MLMNIADLIIQLQREQVNTIVQTDELLTYHVIVTSCQGTWRFSPNSKDLYDMYINVGPGVWKGCGDGGMTQTEMLHAMCSIPNPLQFQLCDDDGVHEPKDMTENISALEGFITKMMERLLPYELAHRVTNMALQLKLDDYIR
jgi:hypothetical protein